jgi:hypothetical protein
MEAVSKAEILEQPQFYKYKSNPGRLFLCFLLLSIFSGFLTLAAQDSESAVIYQAAGSDFSLSSGEARHIFSPEALASGGLILNPKDLIQTGPGVFLEIQLLPSGTLIKLSENTSFVFNGYDLSGHFADFGLLYGRIRLVSGTGGGNKTAVVRAANISVRIEEGDLGIDYVMEPLARSRGGMPKPAFRLYDFSGRAEVFPFPSGGSPIQAGGIQSIAIREREALFLEIASPMVFAERRSLDKGIIDFWNRHNFSGTPPLTMPPVALLEIPGETAITGVPAEIPETAVSDNLFSFQDYLAFSRARTLKNTALVAGVLLTAASITAQGLAYSRFNTEHDAFARNVFTAAYAPMGIGLFTILMGILYNPRIVSSQGL